MQVRVVRRTRQVCAFLKPKNLHPEKKHGLRQQKKQGSCGARRCGHRRTPRRDCAGEGELFGFRCPLHLENFDKTTKKAAPSLCTFSFPMGCSPRAALNISMLLTHSFRY